MNSTKVIFRTFRAQPRETIALFPELPGTTDPHTCLAYVRVGPHVNASADLARLTRPSTPEEVAPLKGELEAIGYDLAPVLRFHPAYYRTRLEQIRAISNPRH
jgi:hypothetical protein